MSGTFHVDVVVTTWRLFW